MKAGSNVYLLGVIVTLCIVIIDISAYSSFRSRARSTRGFKNAALSTARGFGKRDDFPQSHSEYLTDLPFGEKKGYKFALQKARPTMERSLLEWMIIELSKNPDLARILYKKFDEENQIDESNELVTNGEY